MNASDGLGNTKGTTVWCRPSAATGPTFSVMVTVGLVFLVAVALVFDFTNGFHDAANAVATSISTRAMRPFTALGMAAALNVVGALVSTKVAQTVGSGIISVSS